MRQVCFQTIKTERLSEAKFRLPDYAESHRQAWGVTRYTPLQSLTDCPVKGRVGRVSPRAECPRSVDTTPNRSHVLQRVEVRNLEHRKTSL